MSRHGEVTATRCTQEQMEDAAAAIKESNNNVSAAARSLGLPRNTFRNRLYRAMEAGLLEMEFQEPIGRQDDYVDARHRKIAAYQRKKAKGNWRKPTVITLPAEPFRLKLFGDPHLDADGCDFELFERHWLEMGPGVFGVCVGDWFNNWTRALSHLWRGEGDPTDAWVCFDHLMQRRGQYLLAGISGNHDDWTHAPIDPIDLTMKRFGVRYRIGAIRVAVQFDSCDPMFWAIRHKWQGQSMYSAAHWGVRACMNGWNDDLMVGGHIHKSDYRMWRHPDTETVSHIHQLSAFKKYDDYADVHGFMGMQLPPVVDLVIDPRKPRTDPSRIMHFYDSAEAERYLDSIA